MTPRFFCDDHLRRLARWLRAAGYDVAWEKTLEDRDLLRRCREEGRVLLTLDRGLKGSEVRLLPSHDPLEQLRFVRRAFDLDLLSHAFTRCPVCNLLLEETEDVDVPERVRSCCDRFWRCPDCDRTYWEGDHVRHMRKRFEEVMCSS
ncbi:MAG: Mut7-C RNAse domain-containing protein [Planctomycetota bacterium]|jgi:uncharacterized protein with PIN domain